MLLALLLRQRKLARALPPLPLVDAIVEVAIALPDCAKWCRHQHEIHKLAKDWTPGIETSFKYYPYDPGKRRQPSPP